MNGVLAAKDSFHLCDGVPGGKNYQTQCDRKNQWAIQTPYNAGLSSYPIVAVMKLMFFR